MQANPVNELLDKTKLKLGIKNDKELALHFNISKGRISNYRGGHCHPDEQMCFQIAEILDINPAAVIAVVKAQSEKDETKRNFWKARTERYGFALSVYFMVSFGVSELLARGGSTVLHNLNYWL